MFQEGIYHHSVINIEGNQSSEKIDQLAIEEPLEIILKCKRNNNTEFKTLSITMRTPGHDLELAIGFLFSESIIDHYNEILNVDYRINCQVDEASQQTIVIELSRHNFQKIESLERHFYTNSSCGVCGKTSIDLTAQSAKFILKKNESVLKASALYKLPSELKSNQKLFHSTGGIHACGLFDFNSSLLQFAEDVGRHNAMDKLIGKSLISNQVPCLDHILVLSGRASFELLHKALVIGIPVIASVGAPSSLAVQLAENFGATLIGFLKENKMNIYTHPYRIQYEST